ncbi:hypothetical protein KIN20_025302 [Parelaphostrongylus tenuis]|uniref:Uncharacterized protein n=1 Tax=Parelaphostrongylus tenuis TaxID=148309 RepID=A0AAD5QWK0_PARTN|nr:hypothetical protein KIN20_025302 [Parelaphostrongylus tenuis]
MEFSEFGVVLRYCSFTEHEKVFESNRCGTRENGEAVYTKDIGMSMPTHFNLNVAGLDD